jgi:cholesterol oxidase
VCDYGIRAIPRPLLPGRTVFDKINRAAGTDYTPDLFGGPVIGDRATYHPVGGCPLGRATDAHGRLLGYDRLYVMDGSLIPVGIGANPAL